MVRFTDDITGAKQIDGPADAKVLYDTSPNISIIYAIHDTYRMTIYPPWYCYCKPYEME